MTSKQSSSNKRHDVAELARRHGIAPSTLRKRLDRHGDLDRAISEPPMSASQAGRIGARRSSWRRKVC
jgi:transposase-like protein